jgi:hypothetical protein
MYYVRVLRPKKNAPPQFSLCEGCVTPKRCKGKETCDAPTLSESAEGQENRPAKKVSSRVKKQVKKSSRTQANRRSVQAG